LRDAARQASYWLVIELADAGREDGPGTLPQVELPAAGVVDEAQVLRGVYDHWAGARLDAGDFRGALAVYVRGLARLPADPVLLAHLTYVVQRWVAAVEKRDGAAAATDLVNALRTTHPALKDYIGVSPATVWSQARALRDDRAEPLMKAHDWDGAIAVYDEGLKRLGPSSHLKGNREYCEAQKAKAR
jgi:hypothetical protein